MGQVDFNFYQQRVQSASTGNGGGPRVGFFALKQDKEQAIVRFLVDSPEDLEIFAGHRVMIGNSRRLVNCVREVGGPIDACPLCAAGERLEYKVFIHLIEYVKGENNEIIPRAKVWERPASYSNTISNLLNEYGPLSDCVFKVTRNGAAGVRGVTYDIAYGRPEVYRPEFYPKDLSLFEGYSALGTAVLDYDYDRLVELAQNTGMTPAQTYSQAPATPVQATPAAPTSAYVAPRAAATVPAAPEAVPEVPVVQPQSVPAPTRRFDVPTATRPAPTWSGANAAAGSDFGAPKPRRVY